MSSSTERLETLFAAASELPTEERAAYLAETCGNDAELRARVASMLAADESSDGYLTGLSERIGLSHVLEDRSSGREEVGAYRLIELLGRGGMGAVYLAERSDEQFEKRVAIKLVPFGFGSEETERRFLEERQILARLVHPNIARLLDGGVTEEGTPYFVMDYVDGTPIDRYCDERDLAIPERLALFLEVCDAVAFAHGHLIVHRDIKPDNVLVERTGEVKLLDFGIAKALDPERPEQDPVTQGAARPMTPVYASPEMVRGELITTAADVYSLGVLLFHLLTGRLPYRLDTRGGPSELWRAICDDEPLQASGAAPPERRWSRAIRGDLDTIVAKALRKRPEERYRSVEQLSEDLRRHLTGLPVLARRPTLAYRARKFAARNKGLVAAGLAAVVLVTALMVQSQRVADAAERVSREAGVSSQVSDFLIALFEAASPGNSPDRVPTVRELLDYGAETITEADFEDPEVRARLMVTMGLSYEMLGLYAQAEELLVESVEALRETVGREDPQTLRAMNALAVTYDQLGEYGEAHALLSELVEVQRRVLEPTDPDRLNAMVNLAILCVRREDDEEAEALLEEVLAVRVRLLGPEHESTLGTKHNLAILYKEQGRLTEAEALFAEILEPQRRLAGESHPHTLGLRQNIADLYTDQGRFEEALEHYLEAQELARQRLGENHPLALTLASHLAWLHYRMEDYEAADALYREMLPLHRRFFGPRHLQTITVLKNAARCYERSGRLAEAEPLAREAYEGHLAVLGPGDRRTRDASQVLLDTLVAKGSEQEAWELAVELLAGHEEVATRPDATPEERNRFAWVLLTLSLEDFRDPRWARELALGINEETGYSNPRYLQTLARAHLESGDPAQAVEIQEAALERLPEGETALRRELEEALERYRQALPAGAED